MNYFPKVTNPKGFEEQKKLSSFEKIDFCMKRPVWRKEPNLFCGKLVLVTTLIYYMPPSELEQNSNL